MLNHLVIYAFLQTTDWSLYTETEKDNTPFE